MAGAVGDAGVDGLNPWLEGRLLRHGGEGRVLDLGCGRGDWLRWMAARGLQPLGVEHEVDRAALAGRFAPVSVADGARLPLADASVGLVWCIHVLHHLSDPVATLAEARRVLGPGGHLLMAETVEDHPFIRVARRVHPEWDGVAVRSRFTAATLLDMVGAAGFEVVDSRHHSLFSFGAWALPAGGRRAWLALTALERRLPRGLDRFGAHLECLGRAG